MAWLVLAIGAAMALLSHDAQVRIEDRFPPVGEFAVVDGLQVHFTDTGQGTPIVLIHGASTSLLDFDASIVQPLSEAHRVIAVDRPGHGYSERPSGGWPDPGAQARLLHGLLQHLDVRNPVLVGHSWSGSVVLAYLLAYPDSAGGGVLLAGGTHPWEGGVAWYNDLAGLPVLGDLFAWTLTYPAGRLMMDAAIEEVFDPNDVTYEYRARTGVELSLRPATFLANADDVRLLSDFLAGQSQHYAQIERPLLLLTGSDDQIVPSWNHADRLQQQVEDVERIDFMHTGHALHHVHPERVAQAISRFAARHGDGKKPLAGWPPSRD